MKQGQHAPLALAPVLRRSPWLKSLLIGFSALTLLLSGVICFLGFQAWQLNREIPDVDHLAELRAEQPSVVLSADGRQLTQFRDMQREWVKLEQVSPWVIRALLATEDRRFHQHKGVDLTRTVGAAWSSLGGDVQGGSTITQQLARNLFPEQIGRSRNATRKAREMLTALKIERRYSKDEILEIYLNTVPFLYNVFGIEMAARTYFARAASELGPMESATLVGMLKGTHYYNPVVNPDRARARRNTVLLQLVRQGDLAQEEAGRMRAQPLQLRFQRPQEPVYGPAMHYTVHVRRWLLDWAEKNQVDLYSDGLVIHATLDTGLQQLARQAVEQQMQALQAVADVEWAQRSGRLLSRSAAAYVSKQGQVDAFDYFWRSRGDLLLAFIRESPEFRSGVESGKSAQAVLSALRGDSGFMGRLKQGKTRLEAGMVAMDPNSGEVKAWVGSRDFGRDQFDHVAQALRQPGSTFKPLVYGAALELGFSPLRTYLDTRVNIRIPEGGSWMPTDMGAPTEIPMTMREGLIRSRNAITAQVMQDVGLANIVSLARAAGINRSRLDPVPSLALGTSPVSLLEMVSAYSTIASSGQYLEPLVVTRITDRKGRLLAKFGAEPTRAMSEATARELIDMMRGVVTRGTGRNIRSRFGIQADVAGKTGTTQYNTDGWFIMMHPELVAGAWVGFNDGRVSLRSNYWGQGAHNALNLVGDFYRTLLQEARLDAKARFPLPPRFEMLADPGELWRDPGDSSAGAEGAWIVRRGADGTLYIGDTEPPAPFSGASAGGVTQAGVASQAAAATASVFSAASGGVAGPLAIPAGGGSEDPVAAARAAARRAIEVPGAGAER
ncbi:penicillin-binding protein 1A [Lacisediminimonas profundi]|uniref:penicillin-binding protein 1A n=1 Tax=Lacisediminimonas profundi TaxID=2603856 RepID=UPI001F50041C|nr:transglycosylase domain-containing protein [Lacisediminimonas profundi]